MLYEALTKVEPDYHNFCTKLYRPIGDRDFWDAVDDTLKSDAVALGEKELGRAWKPILATYWLAFERTGDRQAYENPYFERRMALHKMVLAECAENQGRFLDEITNALFLICGEPYWQVPAHRYDAATGYPDPADPYIDLFCAETGATLSETLALLGDRIHPMLKKQAEQLLRERILLPFLRHNDYWWMANPDLMNENSIINNWTPWIISNVLRVIMLSPVARDDEKKQAIEKCACITDRYIDFMPQDGGCDEGSDYWSEAGGALFDIAEMFYSASNGKINIFAEEKVANILNYLSAAHISGMHFVNFADGLPVTTVSPGLLYMCGLRTNSESLLSLGGIEMREFFKSHFNVLLHGGFARSLYTLCYGGILKNLPVSPDDPASYLPDTQFLAIREKDVFFGAKGGHNNESHNHNDIGSFIYDIGGEPVLADIGSPIYTKFTFDPNTRYTLYHTQSAWHNLPDINGCMQKEGKTFKAENVTFTDGGKAVFRLRLESAYEKKANVKECVRILTFDRSDKSLTVEDEFVFGEGKNTVTENLILSAIPECDGSTVKVTLPTGKAAILLPDETEASEDTISVADDYKLAPYFPNGIRRIRFAVHGEKHIRVTYRIIAEM